MEIVEIVETVLVIFHTVLIRRQTVLIHNILFFEFLFEIQLSTRSITRQVHPRLSG
jgi:hypothetical protein